MQIVGYINTNKDYLHSQKMKFIICKFQDYFLSLSQCKFIKIKHIYVEAIELSFQIMQFAIRSKLCAPTLKLPLPSRLWEA